MEPALHPGDGLLATPCCPARPGQIRCVPDPLVPGRWLVKRVGAVDGDVMRLESDNSAATNYDSRVFGTVPVRGSYRVLVRIPGSRP